MSFKRISKREAKAIFNAADGRFIYLCPRKFRPGFPFNVACQISGKDYQERFNAIKGYSAYKDAWDKMYTEWLFYNTSYEGGYYPHYYLEE